MQPIDADWVAPEVAMTGSLIEDIGSPDLLPAMDDNLWGFWRDYGCAPGAELHDEPGLRWFTSGVPLAAFNGVPLAQLAEAAVEPALARIQAAANLRGVPAMWWIGPNSQPDDLGLRLERHGLTPARVMVGMAIHLGALERAAGFADFRIERVQGPEMQRLWARLLGEGSNFGAEATRALVDLEPSLTSAEYAGKPRYIGFLSGRPVATSVLVLAAGLAGVYAVSTLPEARGQGVGAAMTAFPLLRAYAQGYRVGILQATTMGYSVYQRLGFQDVCQYRCYSQQPNCADSQ
jgi:GNAT superfamily N-acetyltransferase